MKKILIDNNYRYYDEDDKSYKNGSLYKVKGCYSEGYLFKSDEGFIYPLAVKNRYLSLKQYNSSK